ncbi:MAG: hypothetical protein J6Y21_07035, partial [Clostridia bacterium]|nr:hypothetical protein [Clostridia bacterium]
PSLMRLSLENTALRSLNIDNNTQLRILCLSGSPVGRFPSVPEPYLEYLDVSNASIEETIISGDIFPALKTLNVSSNPGVRGVDMRTFTKLENLDISDTSTSVLVLPDDPAITYLRASNTNIISLDLTKIKHLYVCECYSDVLTNLIVNRYADKLYTYVTPTVILN